MKTQNLAFISLENNAHYSSQLLTRQQAIDVLRANNISPLAITLDDNWDVNNTKRKYTLTVVNPTGDTYISILFENDLDRFKRIFLTLPLHIRFLLNNMRWKQDVFAKDCEISPQTISNIFNGHTSPTLDIFIKMLKPLKLRIDFEWKDSHHIDSGVRYTKFLPIFEQEISENEKIFLFWEALKEAQGIKNNEIVEKTGLSETQISKYCNLKAINPTVDSFVAIFNAINVSVTLCETDMTTYRGIFKQFPEPLL